jgi:hypothetical protein
MHRAKMCISLRYILPEEIDLLEPDVGVTAQRAYSCQQHILLLLTLKKDDLKQQVAKFFRDAYVDFRMSVTLPELLDQIIGSYHTHCSRQLMQRSQAFLSQLVSELQLRYETFRDKKLLRAGGVLRMVNALCAAMGLYPHDPPMSLAKRVSYRGKEEDPNPTPSRKAPRAKLLPSDTFEDDDEEEECQARLARRKRRRSAPPSTEASSSARPTAELSPQAGRPLPSATRPLPSLDHASLALPLAQNLNNSPANEKLAQAIEQLAVYLGTHFLDPWRSQGQPIDLAKLQQLVQKFCEHLASLAPPD